MKNPSSYNSIYQQEQSFGSDDSLRVLKRRRKSSTISSSSDSSSASSRSVSGKRTTSLSTIAKQFFFRKVSSFLTSPDKSDAASTTNTAIIAATNTSTVSVVSPVTSQESLSSSATPVNRKRPSVTPIDASPGTPLLVHQAATISNRKNCSNNSKRRHLSIKTTVLSTRKSSSSSSNRFFSALFKTQSQKQHHWKQQQHQQQDQEKPQTSLDLQPLVNDSNNEISVSPSSNSISTSTSTLNGISYHFENSPINDEENEQIDFTPITSTLVLPAAPPFHDPSDDDTNNPSGRKLTESGSGAAQTLGPALPILGTQQYLIREAEIAATREGAFDCDHDDYYYTVVAQPSVESCWSCSSDTSSVLFLGEADAGLSPCELSRYSSRNSLWMSPRASTCIVQIPEILSLIVEHIDAFNPAPQEQRRGRHNRQVDSQHQQHSASEKSSDMPKSNGTMLSCMLVNKLWYTETRRILYKNLHFRDEFTIDAFMHSNELLNSYDNYNDTNTLLKPKSLVLHKTSSLSQAKTDRLAELVSGGLEWLEMYTCPKLSPSLAFAADGLLRTLILPGCTALTDSTLSQLARASPQLETLDLRACEQISDKSIRVVAHYCPQLIMLNVGRTRHGYRITNKGIRSIARHTQVRVLGVAGCHITDTTVWELALHRGPCLERVSLNNCILLTNASVPKILGYIARSLSVLEVKNLPLLTDLVPFVMFKRYRQYQFGFTPLIEGCELFDKRLREAEYLFEMEISKQIFTDTLEWIYGPDDDIEYISID